MGIEFKQGKILIVAASYEVALECAREKKVPRELWRYVFSIGDFKGLYRDSGSVVWLVKGWQDNRRAPEITYGLQRNGLRTVEVQLGAKPFHHTITVGKPRFMGWRVFRR